MEHEAHSSSPCFYLHGLTRQKVLSLIMSSFFSNFPPKGMDGAWFAILHALSCCLFFIHHYAWPWGGDSVSLGASGLPRSRLRFASLPKFQSERDSQIQFSLQMAMERWLLFIPGVVLTVFFVVLYGSSHQAVSLKEGCVLWDAELVDYRYWSRLEPFALASHSG